MFAYRTSKSIYDDVLTRGTWWSRLYMNVFWGGCDDNEIARKVLAYIPDDFQGRLLDVPVGTAVFTYQKYARMKNADITCVDYSGDMLEQASSRFTDNNQTRKRTPPKYKSLYPKEYHLAKRQ